MVFLLGELGDYEIKFKPEHGMFRKFIWEFFEKEVEPRVSKIEENDAVPADLLRKMGEAGVVIDSHIERMLRDVEITKVYEDSNEITAACHHQADNRLRPDGNVSN